MLDVALQLQCAAKNPQKLPSVGLEPRQLAAGCCAAVAAALCASELEVLHTVFLRSKRVGLCEDK